MGRVRRAEFEGGSVLIGKMHFVHARNASDAVETRYSYVQLTDN